MILYSLILLKIALVFGLLLGAGALIKKVIKDVAVSPPDWLDDMDFYLFILLVAVVLFLFLSMTLLVLSV